MNETTSELFLRLDKRDALGLRANLERELRVAIQSGRLGTGAALPSTRALASDLGISRGVVVEAYEQLLAEGYLRAQQGSGTRVAARQQQRPLRADETSAPLIQFRFDFRPGLPDLSLFPRRAWLASTWRAMTEAPDAAFDYPDPRGAEEARVAVAAYLNRARATVAHPDRMLFSNGSAQGITLVCRALFDRGVRSLAVEDPGHADQCTDIRAAGLRTPRIPVDEQGIRVDRLRRSDARAVLVTPAHQYPTGAVLSADRRAELLEWAAERDAIVIEDDYDAEYRYDREPIGALQGLAPERVVYVGSASKMLSPALRLGWLVLPAHLADAVARAKLQIDRGSPVPEQLAFADFINHGELDRHLRRTRPIYRRRRDALVAALARHLPKLRIHGVAAGLHLLVELRKGMDEAAIVEAARKESIRVYGAAPYRAKPHSGPPALVLGYGGLEENNIGDGVAHLARVLSRN